MRALAYSICMLFSLSVYAEEAIPALTEVVPLNPTSPPEALPSTIETKAPIQPFTAKVVGNKVRMRCKPDGESAILRLLNKGELLLVTDEEGDFFAIQPPASLKAYVFKNYISDKTVEGNRVNIRLEPSTEAPIIGLLNKGDSLEGIPSSKDPKWLEISPPKNCHFYVAKEYLASVGNEEMYVQFQKRTTEATQLLQNVLKFAQSEKEKTFEEINFQEVVGQLESVGQKYSDFPEFVEKAQIQLASFQEDYLKKKVAFLETKIASSPATPIESKSEEVPQITSSAQPIVQKELPPSHNLLARNSTEKSLSWEEAEQTLFQNWATFHPKKKLKDFYEEQHANKQTLKGTIQVYSTEMKNRPGDFLLVNEKGTPIGYLYSTKVDLSSFIGKEVKMSVLPRPNKHFAYPAYFVSSLE